MFCFEKTPKFFVACLLFLSFPVHAIVNIETRRGDPGNQPVGFEGLFNVDVSGDNGNTKKSNLAVGAQFNWAGENDTDLLVLDYAYGKTSGVKDTDRSFMHYRHVWRARDTLSYEAFTQFESNEFTRLRLRSLLGGGVRLRLTESGATFASYLGVGAFRSREDLDPLVGGAETERNYTTRANLYNVVKYRINDHVSVLNMIYYQPDVSEVSDYRLLEQLSIKVALNEALSLKVSLDVAHDSRPPQGVQTTDTHYNTGLEYRF